MPGSGETKSVVGRTQGRLGLGGEAELPLCPIAVLDWRCHMGL